MLLLKERGALVLPGQSLTSSLSDDKNADRKEYKPGRGTHIHDGAICASLSGTLTLTSASSSAPTLAKAAPAGGAAASGASAPEIISVERKVEATPVLPTVNSVILGKVVRTTPRQATLSILSCSSPSLSSSLLTGSSSSSTSSSAPATAAGTAAVAVAPAGAGDASYQALLRTQDVRATQKDQIKMCDSFRPGDIIRAEVISLGDQANFYASTAKNHLGVVIAYPEYAASASISGTNSGRMRPVNWELMRDVRTGREEKRKVAKP